MMVMMSGICSFVPFMGGTWRRGLDFVYVFFSFPPPPCRITPLTLIICWWMVGCHWCLKGCVCCLCASLSPSSSPPFSPSSFFFFTHSASFSITCRFSFCYLSFSFPLPSIYISPFFFLIHSAYFRYFSSFIDVVSLFSSISPFLAPSLHYSTCTPPDVISLPSSLPLSPSFFLTCSTSFSTTSLSSVRRSLPPPPRTSPSLSRAYFFFLTHLLPFSPSLYYRPWCNLCLSASVLYLRPSLLFFLT